MKRFAWLDSNYNEIISFLLSFRCCVVIADGNGKDLYCRKFFHLPCLAFLVWMDGCEGNEGGNIMNFIIKVHIMLQTYVIPSMSMCVVLCVFRRIPRPTLISPSRSVALPLLAQRLLAAGKRYKLMDLV